MTKKRIQTYLHELERALWIRGLADPETLAEIESHLLESAEQEMQRGLSPEEAERQALERFGSVKTVAHTFEKERKDVVQSILLAVGVLVGLFSAWVDSRPTWDDTGILVMGLFLVSALLTLLGGRRPWLVALAVGIWIPLHDIYLSHDPWMLVVLLIPLVGAYSGWVVRLGVRKTLHIA